MLTSYLKIAIRNLRKNFRYAGLNIAGLTIGVAVCLIICLYVANELQYDRWNPLAERIVRPTYEIKLGGMDQYYACVDALVGPESAAELPEIQTWCRLHRRGTPLVRREGDAQVNFREENAFSADSTFFELFPVKMLEGDPNRCLTQPFTMAVSRKLAEKYFSSPQMAMGRTLVLEGDNRYQITAVYEDFPASSHLHPSMLFSFAGDEDLKNTPRYWGYNNQYHTYFLLRKDSDPAAFNRKFESLAKAKVNLLLRDLLGTTPADFEKTGQKAVFHLQNLKDIHLHSGLNAEIEPNGNIRYVYIFSAIAFFILLIACINFMNLATARSAGRAREVGVRKALGSTRAALARQFLTESVVMSSIAVTLGVGLAAFMLPTFRELSGRHLDMPWGEPAFWVALILGAFGVGFLAGSYPAFFLSAFNTVKVLKGDGGSDAKAGGKPFRNALVVFQFAVSITLIISTLLIYRQLQFIQNKNIGFNKNQVLLLSNAYELGDHIRDLKAEMSQNAAIENATVTDFLPVSGTNRNYSLLSVNRAYKETDKVMQHWTVDADYIQTLGMELKSGRNFDPARVTDQSAIILNETAARQFGFPDPIGQKVYTSVSKKVDSKPEDFIELTIIGVVKDFHYESLHDNIAGLYLQYGQTTGQAAFRIKEGNPAPVIASLGKQWKTYAPNQPFSYRFLDDAYNRMYESEQRIGRIALIFALMSILISCLGLFGLAAFTAEQRTREIGIRKVLGASVGSVMALLSKDFLKLVALSFILATPVTWWAMNKWLFDFAYHIDIGWQIFALGGAVAVIIALLTVASQSLRAATSNPIHTLKR